MLPELYTKEKTCEKCKFYGEKKDTMDEITSMCFRFPQIRTLSLYVDELILFPESFCGEFKSKREPNK